MFVLLVCDQCTILGTKNICDHWRSAATIVWWLYIGLRHIKDRTRSPKTSTIVVRSQGGLNLSYSVWLGSDWGLNNHGYIYMYIYIHVRTNICTDTVKAICLGGITKQGNIYNVYYVYSKLQKHTFVVTHLLSERVLFTHWMGVVLIQGILAHWKGVVLFFLICMLQCVIEMDKNVFRGYLNCLNSCQLHNEINPSAVYWEKLIWKG